MRSFREEVTSNMQNQEAAIKKLETQVDYLSKQILTHCSPSGAKTNQREECKAITLRSGKELKETTREAQEERVDANESDKEEAPTPHPSPPKEKEILKPYAPKAPYPQRLKKDEKDNQFSRFLDIFKQFQINISFAEHKLPQKLKDPGSLQISCIIGEITVEKALCDLVASINLMSLAMMRRMKIEEAKPTRMALQLADRSFKFPH
ncbi:uncharacterized protein LOC107489493 [Arachis duranensis]|uniref:Uncharacterized protein LOC107489493 n=1 Tax=Arachis duranensis TaxID=130453 RepID=A0A6P4DEK5_ARADU|nr:uncharacterized protein LOC107489493 [Arachis duranensis]